MADRLTTLRSSRSVGADSGRPRRRGGGTRYWRALRRGGVCRRISGMGAVGGTNHRRHTKSVGRGESHPRSLRGARVTTAVAAAYSEPAVSAEVGIVLAGVFLAGVTLRAWAIHELGAQYSHRVVRISESGLICSGPYRVLRHPAYAGMLLANIGFVGYFASPASIAALALLAAAILWRIRVEEAVLIRSPGYREFASSRRRILPGVW